MNRLVFVNKKDCAPSEKMLLTPKPLRAFLKRNFIPFEVGPKYAEMKAIVSAKRAGLKHNCRSSDEEVHDDYCNDHCVFFENDMDCGEDCDLPHCLNQPLKNFEELLAKKPRSFKSIGKGMVASRDINPSEFISEYCGVIVPADEALIGASPDNPRSHYYAKYDPEGEFVIDAGIIGSRSKYINFACARNANALMERRIDGDNNYRIILTALKNIKKGEQILYTYDEDIQPWAKECRACKKPSCETFRTGLTKLQSVPEKVRKLKHGEKQTDAWRDCFGSTPDGKEYVCLICAKLQKKENIKMSAVSYQYLTNLVRHIRNSHRESPETFSCKMCNKKFKNMYNFNTHNKNIHRNPQIFKCSECRITTTRQFDLVRHYKRCHAKKGHYLCGKPIVLGSEKKSKQHSICGQFLATKANLMAHIKTEHPSSHCQMLKRSKVNLRDEFLNIIEN